MNDKRLIDANALSFTPEQHENALCLNGVAFVGRGAGKTAEMIAGMLERMIDNAHTIDAVEVVHGQWILGVPITCSVCGKPAAEHDSPISFWESPYCPWCGAKMDGGATE